MCADEKRIKFNLKMDRLKEEAIFFQGGQENFVFPGAGFLS
jgi:hypothetical protein